MMKRKGVQAEAAKPVEEKEEEPDASKTFHGGFFAISSPVLSPSSKYFSFSNKICNQEHLIIVHNYL